MTPREATRGGKTAALWTALVAIWFFWGTTYLAIRVGVRTMPPFLMAATRFLIAGGILYLIVVRTGDRAGDRVRPVHWRSAFVIGAALLLGGNGLVSFAEQRVPSGIASLLIATVPLWLAIGDRIAFGQRLSWPAVLGIAIGFGGLLLLIGQPDGGRLDPIGAGALIVASLSWAAGSLYSRRAPLPKRPLVGAAMEMIAGGLVLAVVGIATGELGRLDLAAVSGESILGLAWLIVFGSWVGFVAYIWLLSNAPISLVGTYAYVNPIVAVLLGVVFLHEPLSARTVLAGLVIVVGVALIVTARAPKVSAPEAVPGEPSSAPPPLRRSRLGRALRAVRRVAA